MGHAVRVLHILKYYRPSFTGEGIFMERCINHMQQIAPEIAHDLLVTTTPQPTHPPRDCSSLGQVFYLTNKAVSGWRHEIRLLLWFVRHIHRYHTVHVRTHADRYFLAYLYAKLLRRRLILSATLDDSVPVLVGGYRPSLRNLALRVFRLFDGFISVSPKLHAETCKVIPESRCYLVPYGIALPSERTKPRPTVRQQLGIPDSALVLIFVGGICARKDPLLLVRQLPEILRSYPDTWLLLVGPELEPDYAAAIRATIEHNNLTDRIIFIGEVKDPHPYFAAADIMTFGSRQEGFGMVVPEAQANGLPVVVRHLPGVNDLFVIDGETGFRFDSDQEYLSSVLRLAGDPSLRQQIGEQASAFVRSCFGMHAVARRYLDIYGCPGPTRSAAAALPAACDTKVDSIGTTSSIVNPRFHTNADAKRLSRPHLLTLVDAEEAFNWGTPFSRGNIDVGSMLHQTSAHRIFERYGVVPTYLVDYPVITQDAGRTPVLEWLQQGACDVGAQLHPWVNPPFVEEVSHRNSYSGNLPLAVEFAKIRRLTEEIESAFGLRPQLYRAGRYGAGPRTGDIIKELGYVADSSVVPRWDFSEYGGPDFRHISCDPYWIDDQRHVLEIPATAAVVGRLARQHEKLWPPVFGAYGNRLGIPALTARLGLLERIKLTPEGITIQEAKRLVRFLIAQGQKVFVLTYHTPSLVPGNTPYVRTSSDLGRFLLWLEEFYAFFQDELGGMFSTWREVRDWLSEPECSSAAPAEISNPA